MDISKIKQVRVKCTLKTSENLYPAGSLVDAPIPADIMAELAAGADTVEVVAEVVDVIGGPPAAFPSQAPPAAPGDGDPGNAGAGDERQKLIDYAAEQFGVTFDKRKGIKKIKAEIALLIESAAAQLNVKLDPSVDFEQLVADFDRLPAGVFVDDEGAVSGHDGDGAEPSMESPASDSAAGVADFKDV